MCVSFFFNSNSFLPLHLLSLMSLTTFWNLKYFKYFFPKMFSYEATEHCQISSLTQEELVKEKFANLITMKTDIVNFYLIVCYRPMFSFLTLTTNYCSRVLSLMFRKALPTSPLENPCCHPTYCCGTLKSEVATL